MMLFSIAPVFILEHTKQTPAWNLLAVILQITQYCMKEDLPLMHNMGVK